MGIWSGINKYMVAFSALISISRHNVMSFINSTEITSPRKLGDKIVVLGNGKSQDLFWNHTEDFQDYDLLCVNFFPINCERRFFEYKPKYYCMIEPEYFETDGFGQEKEKMKNVFSRVDWPLTIVTYDNQELNFDNSNISHIKISKCRYDGEIKRLQCYLWKRNLASPLVYNIINFALFFSVVFGYKDVALFGLDFDYFKYYSIGADGKVVVNQVHIYDKNEKGDESTLDGMYYELLSLVIAFECFISIRYFADKEETSIINYNFHSFVDVFEKSKRYIADESRPQKSN